MTRTITTQDQLTELAQFLKVHRPLWEQRPFVSVPVPWETDWPALSRACRAVSEMELPTAEADPVGFFSAKQVEMSLMEQLRAYDDWASLGPAEPYAEPPRPEGVDGRKWSQVVRFTAALRSDATSSVTQWVDWCAGKGRLGAAVTDATGQPVTALELDAQLVSRMSAAVPAPSMLRFVQADVLTDDFDALIATGTGVVALHACGHLNSRLLSLARTRRPALVALVPCCYQRIDRMHFVPLSKAAQATGMKLTRHLLRLPALDEVTTSKQKRLFRKREMAFRQGTDLLLRKASGVDEYTPLGKIPPYVIRGSFDGFAGVAAAQVKRLLPPCVNWAEAEAAGWARQHLVNALSLSRQLFRRALERWLFLDRVAFLEEGGFQVTYGTFCPRTITPRNLMLWAVPE